MDYVAWKDILKDAYENDPYSHAIMEKFNARIRNLKQVNKTVEKDYEANMIFAELILAVNSYLDGKPVTVLYDQMQEVRQ